MMIEYITFTLSLLALYYGAKLLTMGAKHIAEYAGISEFVIGATIVALGTSLPELGSSVFAMFSGHPGIVVGNVIGSNIANIGLALGFAGMLYSIYLDRVITDIDIPFLIASTVANLAVFMNLRVTWFEGTILLVMYLAFVYHETKAHLESGYKGSERFDFKYLLAFAAGLILLYLGAKYLISSVLIISIGLNINEAVVAFFLVSLGTSLPEIATSIVAIKEGRGDIAIGNVLGSNTANSLVVLGCSSLVGDVTIDGNFLYSTLPVMILLSLLLGFMALNNRISRLEGTLLFLIYCLIAINLL